MISTGVPNPLEDRHFEQLHMYVNFLVVVKRIDIQCICVFVRVEGSDWSMNGYEVSLWVARN